ncbi:MAG: hypothetical protein QG642_200 [Patescibacteria group bacterium]|nr:hypothetical protein [Patescibacteria group bacterium]
MKVNFHYHFYSRIIIALLIFVCGFFLWQQSVDTRALVGNVYRDDSVITGWAWNDQIGWIALSCENDFDGDGEPDGNYNGFTRTCTNRWGLTMDVNEGDPDVKHIRGCAWAGNIADMSSDYTAPGWICFSDPGGTDAPANGVLMSQAGGQVTTCSCEPIEGTCPAGSAVNRNNPCLTYNMCTGNNICSSGSCSISGGTCTNNFDCQFACESSANDFIAKGVCYDYENNTPAQQLILENLRGALPPFTTGDAYMHSCYINKDCYDPSVDPNNAGHPKGECVYPQYGSSTGGGAGKCMVSPTVEQSPSTSCVYDFDCDIDNGRYCALTLSASLPNAPTSCTAACTGGYEPINTTITQSFYTNALTINPSQADGFASILKMESSGYADANKIGFPIGDRVADSYSPANDRTYDIDNPNNIINDDNPIRGCFNCYREKTYQCVSGATCSCVDQNVDSCEDTACEASSEGDKTCSLYELAPAVCENCQEYFYYTEAQNTCSIRTDISCANVGSACDNNFGTCLAHSEGDLKKVLTGFNCTDCIVDDFANSCTLNAENINSNRCHDCTTYLGGINYDSDVYRLGGVLYDNQHGRSSNGALCGWGYNAYQGATGRDGFGWFNFSPRISTSTKPYFSVEQGNIYSKGRITTLYQPPINKYNASYLIEAGGAIRNFVSGASKSTSTSAFKGELPNRPIIDFLSLSAGQYKNALGKLDYTGLITVVDTSTNKNKYGSIIHNLTQANFEADVDTIFNTPFNNNVFYVERDNNATYVQIQDTVADLMVRAGNINSPSGAGIIIVNGSLKIEKNITYDSVTSVTNLRQIPSLVWIVKGDVEIAHNVSELAGTFIVLGRDGQQNCYTLNPNDRAPQHCGQFLSVHYDTSQNNYPNLSNAGFLKIKGNVLARKFVLVRTAVDPISGTPAEQFINDGRLQTNPPLGLKDMSRVIPRFSSY